MEVDCTSNKERFQRRLMRLGMRLRLDALLYEMPGSNQQLKILT
jgi:hypothetical protein